MSLTWRGYFPLFLLIGALLPFSTQRTQLIDVTSSERIILLSKFGFAPGGEFNISLTSEGTKNPFFGHIVVWNHDQWQLAQQYRDGRSRVDDVCITPSLLRQEVAANFSEEIVLQEENNLRLCFLNCARGYIRVKGQVIAENPGPLGYMSVDEQPLLYFYTVLACLYPVLLLPYLFLMAKNRIYVNWIQLSFAACVGMKIVETVLRSLYFRTHYDSSAMKTWTNLAFVTADSMFIAFQLLVSLGWVIMRDSLELRERHLFVGGFLLFEVFEVLYSMCDDPENLCTAYMLSYMVVKLLNVLAMLIALSTRIDFLQRKRLDQEVPLARYRFEIKAIVYGRFRWAFLCYQVMPTASVYLISTTLSWKHGYLTTMLEELMYLTTYVVVGWCTLARSYPQLLFKPEEEVD